MKKKSLKKFNPDKVAEIELDTWKAYYKHQFLRLFFLLVHLVHENFGVSCLVSLRIAFYAALAASDFRLNKGKEKLERVLKMLINFCRVISSHSIEPFDYKKAAELELQWWMIDRYPDRYKISREEGLALAMAAVYSVEPSKLEDYAKLRAEAMVLQDEAENLKNREADWNKIGTLLRDSWRSIYQVIQ